MDQPSGPYPMPGNSAKASLEAWLDFVRERTAAKVVGLSDEDARRSLVGSETSVTGIIQHLAWVEHTWFHQIVAGLSPSPEFEALEPFSVDSVSLAAALNLYLAECERSRRVVDAVVSLDTPVANAQYPWMDLSWVLTHMIEETSRHLGQLDILREQLDGKTGR